MRAAITSDVDGGQPVHGGGPASGFSDFLEEHDELQELFLQHQEALVRWQPELAQVFLARYVRRLRAHARLEDARVLPAYERLGERPRGAGAELFRAEHRKIEAWLDELLDLVASLAALPEPVPRALIAVLDRERVFKNVVDHHHVRERVHLYPTLERELGEEERRALLR